MVAKITLIITVYNKGKFLERCLDSVVAQGYKNVEVIIVDDGSTDISGKICDYYSDLHGYTVYHTENRGVSAARNLGLDKATGDYVTFLDADDFLARDAFYAMTKNAKKGYNIYQFSQYRMRNCINFDERLVMPYRAPEGHYSLDYIPKYWVMVWNKMFKRDFLNAHGLRFKPGMQFGEDALFSAECILANNGFYHAAEATVYHVTDDMNSLCRGPGLTLERVEYLDEELNKLYEKQTTPAKKHWMMVAINEHRHSRLFKRLGFNKGSRGYYDIVYLVKDSPNNPELIYSLRSVEQNWPYNSVWFCGGCPDNIRPDHQMKIEQTGLNKWEKVRNMIIALCKNDKITEDFWVFNDDFFVLKKRTQIMPPQYNGDLMTYIERIERKQGSADAYTVRLRQANNDLAASGNTTLNYEVHKPMLFNRKKLLQVLEMFPNTPGYRSLYGNYWKIGGQDKHDMKIKMITFNQINKLDYWEFVSTSDKSFEDGNVGVYVRNKFKKRSRFEK